MHHLRTLISAVLVVSSWQLMTELPVISFPPVTAYANSACNTAKQNVFDGYNDTYPAWGVSAWIVTRSAGLCTQPPTDPYGSASFTSAWSMIYSQHSLKPHYAQSGYIQTRGDNGQNFIFAAWTQNNCTNGQCSNLNFMAVGGGGNTQYWSAYQVRPQGNQMTMWAGNCNSYCYTIASTSYDPSDSTSVNWWPGPWVEQYNGETTNSGTDVPGSASTKASFTSLSYAPNEWTSGAMPTFDAVADFPWKSTAPTEPYYCFQNTGDSAFNIWTSGTC